MANLESSENLNKIFSEEDKQSISKLQNNLTPQELINKYSSRQIYNIFDNIYSISGRNEYVSFLIIVFNKDINVLLENQEYLDCLLYFLGMKYGNINFFTEDNLLLIFEHINKKELYKTIEDHYATLLIESLSIDNQKNILDSFTSIEFLYWFLSNCTKEVFNDFFYHNNKSSYMYLYFDIETFLKNGTKLNPNILFERELFEKLKNNNIIKFRDNFNRFTIINPSYFLEQQFKYFILSILGQYDPNSNLFTPYKKYIDDNSLSIEREDYLLNKYELDKYLEDREIDIDELVDEELEYYLHRLTSVKLSELIIDYLFQDNIYNVLINIREILRYNNNLDSPLINQERLNFYQNILIIDNLPNEEKIALFNKYKNENIALNFYEDIRLCKNHCYDAINSQLFKIEEATLNKELTDKYGVPVVDMRDKEFLMLVRCFSHFDFKTHRIRDCYSLIANWNTRVFMEIKNTFGYSKMDKNFVSHTSERDLYSEEYLYNGIQVGTDMVNRISTIKELLGLDSTNNEISILNKKTDDSNEYISENPEFIVCFDNIKSRKEPSIEEAKRLNIPIVLINYKYLDDENIVNTREDYYTYDYSDDLLIDKQIRRM